MRRVVSLFLPTWSSDRLRRRGGPSAPPPDRPLVTSWHDGRRRVIASVDHAAEQAGLKIGMSVIQAQTLVADLAVREFNPAAEQADLLKLSLWSQRYTPLTAPDHPSGLWLDVTGVAHLFGGETALLADLTAALQRGGIACRAALADTPGTAHAVARFSAGSRCRIVPSGEEKTFLADLPIAALRLPPLMVQELRLLGFERVGALLAVPVAPLILRFGAELALRLDQALGRLFEPIEPVFSPDAIQSRLGFAEPIAARDSIARAVRVLTDKICRQLEQGGQGARRLDLLLHRVDGSYQIVRAGLARPSHDPVHLGHLFEQQLDSVEPGFGIETVTLAVSLAETMPPRPAGMLFGAADETESLAVLTDRLVNRGGRIRLYRARPVESDLPERSVAFVPPCDAPCGQSWDAALPRPSRLIPVPEPVEVTALLPDLPPAWFIWRGVRHRVRQADGPERIHGEWWRYDEEIDLVRDYYRVEDEAGVRFWLFRTGVSNEARWYLHGLFG